MRYKDMNRVTGRKLWEAYSEFQLKNFNIECAKWETIKKKYGKLFVLLAHRLNDSVLKNIKQTWRLKLQPEPEIVIELSEIEVYTFKAIYHPVIEEKGFYIVFLPVIKSYLDECINGYHKVPKRKKRRYGEAAPNTDLA